MAMVKVMSPADQPGLLRDGPACALIKVARSGLRGDDFRALVKRAGHLVADAVKRLDFKPGEVGVHNISLGASEFYGPNRNGDGFKEACCRKYHKTFEKYARAYRDHCFPAGVPVVMGDRTRKPIEQVARGDEVMTLEGPCQVTRAMARDYDGPATSLKLAGSLDDLVATDGHPVLVLRRRAIHCRYKYSCLTAGPHMRRCPYCRRNAASLKAEWVPIETVARGDYLLLPAPPHGDEVVPEAFAELVGWVASEGYLGDRGSIQFTFSSQNRDDMTAVRRCLEDHGLHVCVTPRPQYGLTMLTACSATLHRRLCRYVQGVKAEKRLTAEVLDWGRDSLLRMLGAYIDGDGNVATSKRRGQLRIRSSSPAMLAALADVIHALGYPTTTNFDNEPAVIVSPTTGDEYWGNGSGCVAVNSAYSPEVCAYSRKAVRRGGRRPQELRWGRLLLRRALAVKPTYLTGPVYNLEVRGPHHYLAQEVLVHNCNKDPAQSYGVIKLALYNEPMKRIELIKAYNGTKEAAERNGGLVADKELELLEKDGSFDTSMACRVPYDVCFPAGTLVETSRGLRPMEGVSAGDLVRTHLGDYRPVVRTMRRPYAGTVVALDVLGCPDSVRTTANHPVLVLRRRQVARCHGTINGQRRRHTFREGREACITCKKDVRLSPRWATADTVRRGDFVVYPVRPPGRAQVPGPYAYLAGLYLGDGSPIRQRRGRHRVGEQVLQGVSVTIDKATPDVISRVRAAATQVHGRQQPVYESGDGKNSVQVHIYHQDLARFLVEVMGEGSAAKAVNLDVFRWDHEARLQFLAGVLDSDGSVDRNARYGTGRFLTTNRQLAFAVQQLWWGLSVPAGCHSQVMEEGFAPGCTCYTVSVPRWGVALLDGYAAKAAGITPSPRPRSNGFRHGRYMYLPVQRVVQDYDELDVYNLQVKDHESYLVGFAVHNCSVCGNRAKNRSEYCTSEKEGGHCKGGGLKSNIAGTLADGTQVYADNPDPLWFDDSWVWRHADRIAATTGIVKAAAALPKGGAALAEAWGVTMPWEVALEGADDVVKLAADLARREVRLRHRPPHDSLSLAFCKEAAAPRSWADHGTSVADAVAALNAARVLMPLEGFLEMVGGTKAAALADVARPHLPGVFGRLIADGSLDKIASDRPAQQVPSGRAKAWAQKRAVEYSLDRDRMLKRAALGAIYHAAPPPPAPPPARPHGVGEELARAYALYKLAFLRSLSPAEAGFDLTCEAVVRHNHV
jgi:hypothetical protein